MLDKHRAVVLVGTLGYDSSALVGAVSINSCTAIEWLKTSAPALKDSAFPKASEGMHKKVGGVGLLSGDESEPPIL